jgi:GNAT superfamily N-acetyltransferase
MLKRGGMRNRAVSGSCVGIASAPGAGGPSSGRLQAALRRSAQRQYESVSVPPFTLFFHPTDAFPAFSYAIPYEPCGGDLGDSLSKLRREFAARGRRPRFEFIEEYIPELGPALLAAGFVEEARQPLMVCTPDSHRPAPEVPGLTITQLCSASSVDEIQEFLTVQRRGFDPLGGQPATAEEAVQFRGVLGEGLALVARLWGEPVGVGLVTEPLDGVAEVVGLATLEPYRRRGIGTALAAQAVESALEQGVEAAMLSAEDERAGRVYERVGFVRRATMLAYASL